MPFQIDGMQCNISRSKECNANLQDERSHKKRERSSIQINISRCNSRFSSKKEFNYKTKITKILTCFA